MNKFIYVGKKKVAVSEEIYQAYYKMKRREKYMEYDVKVGRIDIDSESETVQFMTSKEDSINRLMDQGVDFKDEQMIEDILCDKATLLILQEAMVALNEEEKELINAIYYEDLTVREIGSQKGVSHMAIVKRHKKVLDKLRKFF